MVEIGSYGNVPVGEVVNFSKNSFVIQMPQEDESGTLHTQNDSLQFPLYFIPEELNYMKNSGSK
jgi:hypothetical protein